MVGYSVPNPIFTYILNIWFVNTVKWSNSSISNNSSIAIYHNSIYLKISDLFKYS